MNNSEKIWEKMYSYWMTLNVPQISTRKFQFEKEYVDCPWYSIKRKGQLIYESNPIIMTAHHLILHLPTKNPEFEAAYKIYVVLREYKQNAFDEVISYVFKKNNEEIYNWWHPNYRNLIPPVSYSSDFPLYSNLSTKDWKNVVEATSEIWKSLAEEYSIVIIPDFLDRDSEEYKFILEKSMKNHEDAEYREYLRLKEKFGK